MAQQDTQAAGSGQHTWDGKERLSAFLDEARGYELQQMSAFDRTPAAGSGNQAQEMRRIANDTLARALELDQQSLLLSEHRNNLMCEGDADPALADALLTASAVLGTEAFTVRKTGQLLAELAAQAESYQHQSQRPEETPGACPQCGGHGMWRPPYHYEGVPCDLCTAQPPKGGAA